jgi:predicted NUDIX family NTP pyrophosphohydrolase
VPEHSAGILVHRRKAGLTEVLLVHPGGPYWAQKDAGAWSIPKGQYDPAEEDPLDAAKREFHEETGQSVDGEFRDLGEIRQPSRKLVRAFAIEADPDVGAVESNTLTIEWPPRSGRYLEIPEIDRAEWFPLPEASARILRGQAGFLERLAESMEPEAE